MEEAAVHRAVSEDANGAGVGVGQDRLGPVLVADLLKACGDCVEGFVPGDALEGFMLATLRERAFFDSGTAAHGIEQAVGRIDAVEVFGNLTAEESAGNGVAGVALKARRTAAFVDGDQQAAGVRAVVRTDSMDGADGHRLIVCPPWW